MSRHRLKIYVAITVVLAAVILLWWTLSTWFGSKTTEAPVTNVVSAEKVIRDPLNGQKLSEPFHDFLVAVMLDNGYDVRPQYGLSKADIIYEALAESNITRLMAIYHGQDKADKVGPVRSARPYFLDWAEEYQSVYMHVGGSPDALQFIDKKNIENVDQIGAGEIYFWRDAKLRAPHNVFTSSANWLRVAELRALPKTGQIFAVWNFAENTSTDTSNIKNLAIDYNDIYKVEWRYNQNLGFYQRWQGEEKFVYDDGEQARADNVLVQIAPSKTLDDLGRRAIDTRKGGAVLLFNKFGVQSGYWQRDSRTLYFNDKNEELKFVPGKTWVQVVDSLDLVKY